MSRKTPSVVLVGRPNVGKSTLFNRMTGSRRAIVNPMAGTTRDALARPVVWRGTSFQLFDTGGLYGESQDPLHELVVQQGRRAIVGADLLVLLVDGREGLIPGDERIARELRETGTPVMLAINKTDDKRSQKSAMEFFQLGFDPVTEISAEHGTGVADLMDEIVARVNTRSPGAPAKGVGLVDDDGEPTVPSPEPQVEETRFAIVGRPNVGKSSLVNRLLRTERVLVSDMPGTTRDAIDSPLVWHRRHFRIIDTAGMRRPGRVSSGGKVEMVSVALAKESIADADVVALVIDASTGASDQDAAIGGEADRAGRGIVIIVNKWDLVKTEDHTFVQRFDDALRQGMRFLDFAPILHISALTGERTTKVLEVMDRVAAARLQRIPTPALNKFIERVTAANPPVSPGRKHVRIMYAAQTGVAPPSFLFFTNVATTFHFSYERFLINKLREEFGFIGSPIRIQVRRRDRNTNVGGARKPKRIRHGAKANMVQKERKDRRARKNRRDKKER
ncbi:MAG TPA: ribosome biogenesis GTPase Der [Vicinamibacterales bacterium]|jgi:GTP-binding protein|nr:ribosome biogenesis GTPase Der [Vicinamibacterales bacterium]